jgi:1-acyl-sn-glycerol-3-phosphate acyltransferase
MFYHLLKTLLRLALRIFFKSIHLNNLEKIPTNTPLIIVANHPNTLLDPLVIATHLPQEVHFLAKSTLFNSPIKKWLMSKLNMLPIYRKQDLPKGTKNDSNNQAIFQKCFDFLKGKGTILIFPEGISVSERKLQEIKTGAARIALGAESQYAGLNVGIVTIGLNYSSPQHFRSEVFLNVGEILWAKDFKKDETHEHLAVENLTNSIKNALENHIITTQNQEEDTLVKNIELLYKQKLAEEFDLSSSKAEEEFLITKKIIEAIRYFEKSNPLKIQQLKEKMSFYIRQLERLNLKDEHLNLKRKQHIGGAMFKVIFYIIFGFPFYVYGILNNYIPYILPSKIADNVNDEIEYRSSIMFATGILSFTLFYAIQTFSIQYFFQNPIITILYGISLPITGFFVLDYWKQISSMTGRWTLFKLLFAKTSILSSLLQTRKEVFEILEEAKREYLNFMNKNV